MQDWAEWQKAYEHGVVLVWPPEPIRAKVNALRQDHDPVSQSYAEAHISLTPPFLRAPSDEDWRLMEEVVRDVAAIDITLGPVKAWPNSSVIYLEVRPVDELERLRNILVETGLFAAPAFRQFVPHMTITEGLSGIAATEDQLGGLKNAIDQHSFRCDHLTYLRPDRTFCFKPLRSIALTNRKA